MRTVLSVSLPEKLANDLNAFAGETGRNKSDIVKESLAQYFWEARLRKAQGIFYSKAKAQGIVSEDDMLREIS